MKPVYQTIVSRTRGDCFRACIASIFELQINKVPNFIEDKNPRQALQLWLKKRNLYFLEFIPNSEYLHFFPSYHLIIHWASVKRDIKHVVVAYQGKIVHDPHKKGMGLSKVNRHELTYGFFVVLDPSIM